MRPWKCGGELKACAAIKTLQWGRGLAAVGKLAVVWTTVMHKNMLQWGRGLAAVEITKPGRGRWWLSPLQWGRGLAAAEMSG